MKFSGLQGIRSNKNFKVICGFASVFLFGALLGVGGLLMNLFVSATDEGLLPEHELEISTTAPVGETVGNGDNVLYQIYGNTNFADATNVLVTVKVSNAVFDVIPDICKTVSTEEYPVEPLSSISEDRTTLVCNAGTWIAGSSFRIDVTARALGPNNGQVTMSTSLASDAGMEVTGTGIPKRIVAGFTADIGISGGSHAYYDSGGSTNGKYYVTGGGMVIPIYWHVAVDKGSERPGSTSFTAKLNLSNPTHPDQVGFSGFVPFSGGSCVPLTTETRALPYINTWNVGLWAALSEGGQSNSNTNSGTCTLSGSGSDFTLTVSGMDTSLRHAPTRSARDSVNHYPNYGALPANELQYASGVAMIWVPWGWFDPAGVGRASSFATTVSGYNPTSISGQANSGENTTNNETVYTILPAGGWSGLWQYGPNWGATHAFLPGDTIRSGVGMNVNPHETNVNNSRVLCSVKGYDYTFKDMMSTLTINGNYSTNDPRVVLQYTTAALPAERLSTTCADSVGGWTSYNPSSPPSDAVAAGITRVRAIYSPSASGTMANYNMYVNWKINDNATLGAQLWNHNMVSYDGGATWPSQAEMTSADPSMCVTMTAGKQYGCTNSYHDYAFVVGAKATVKKDTVDSKATYSVGEAVDYYIAVSTAQKADSFTKAIVKDTLPKGLTYIDGSADIEPVSVSKNGAGVTTIIWHLDRIAYNEKREIKYQARVTTETGVTSVTNTAVVDLYNEAGVTLLDTRDATLRTSSDTINITSSGYVEIFKNSEKQEITATDEMAFVVTMQNHDANPHEYTDIIDVLPYNGDGRIPETSYHGTLDRMAVDSNQKDVVFYYTTADPSTISVNPHDPSNGDTVYSIEGNTVGWTTERPESGITAIRAIGGEWTPEDGDIVLRISFERDGWHHGDVFSNSVGTVARSTILKMISSDAVVTVEDESLIPEEPAPPEVPSTGEGEGGRTVRTKVGGGTSDDSYAKSMAMLFAGIFMALGGIVGVTVFILKGNRLN